jgi:hypothetical protein
MDKRGSKKPSSILGSESILLLNSRSYHRGNDGLICHALLP